MKCSQCQAEAPLHRIAMNWHRFCSAACVIKYAGTDKNVPWRNSEAYQMYYEMDFDDKIKGTLSETAEKHTQEDTGYKEIQAAVESPVETPCPDGASGSSLPLGTEGTVVSGSEGRQGSSGENVCLCRSGILTKYRQNKLGTIVAEPRGRGQNCANKTCACYAKDGKQVGSKDGAGSMGT